MDKPQAPSETVLKSILTPDQLSVQSMWHKCEVTVDSKTFLHIWRLSELGIPPYNIVTLLNDIAKYSKKKTKYIK